MNENPEHPTPAVAPPTEALTQAVSAEPLATPAGAEGAPAAASPPKVDPAKLAAIIADIEARQKAAGPGRPPAPAGGPKRGPRRSRDEGEDGPAHRGHSLPAPEPLNKPSTQALRNSLNSEIEAELEAAMAGFDAPKALADLTAEPKGPPTQAPSDDGGRKKGTILSIHGDDVFVDIGGRTQGVLSMEQFSEPPEVGQTVEVTIQGFDAANGCLLLSRRGALAQAVDWTTVAEGMVVEAKVTGENKGGLTVEVNGIRGFIPISQLELFRVEDLKPYVNQRITCLVTEANPIEKNLVLSRRALLEQERDELKQKVWAELAEGQTRSGVVRSVKEFGAFIDLGGVDGLLPIGELGWGRVDKIEDQLSIGQRLDVFVLRIDREKNRLTLSRKPLMKSPWEESAGKFSVGGTLPGKVTKLMDFGAFVELEPGVEGLVHISEIATKRINRPGDVLKEGQAVVVQILRIDEVAKKLSLSIKAVQKAAEEAARAEVEAKLDAARAAAEAAEDAKPQKPIVRRTDLKGGTGLGGPLFKLPG